MQFKPSDVLRFLIAIALAIVVLGFIALCVIVHQRGATATAPVVAGSTATASRPEACGTGPAAGAAANKAALDTLAWAPFRGRAETGWRTYAPLVARAIGTRCEPESPGFAAALAAWQRAHGLPADGVLTDEVFARLNAELELRRPFVRVTATGVCPSPPAETTLATAAPADSYGGMTLRLRPAALTAYRAMVAAARVEDPRTAADPQVLTLFSGYRSPEADGGRCAREGNCGSAVRANCSAHRTGLAIDLNLGAAPGSRPDSSDDANRLYLSRTPAYRWLVANADRFGFVNYPFEPWHWEWVGEAP